MTMHFCAPSLPVWMILGNLMVINSVSTVKPTHYAAVSRDHTHCPCQENIFFYASKQLKLAVQDVNSIVLATEIDMALHSYLYII